MRKKLLFFSILLTLVSLGSQLQADTVALTFSGGTTYAYVTGPLPNTIGWQFQLSAPVLVTQLGFFDVGGNGLVANHDVAIWDVATQMQLAVGTVTNAGTYADGFYWVSIPSVLLSAGTYVIGAGVNNDDWYYTQAASIFTAGPVTYMGGVHSLGGFGYPGDTGFQGANGRFGPDFQFQNVPEPSSFLLIGSGLLGVAGVIRRKLLL